MAIKDETKEQKRKRLAKSKRRREKKARGDRRILREEKKEKSLADQHGKDTKKSDNPSQTDITASTTNADSVDNSDSNEVVQDIGYSPFSEPVKKREYTIPKIDASELAGELEVPTFSAPTMDDYDEMENAAQTRAEPKAKKEEQKSYNPQFNEMPSKEKKKGAEMMADVAIDGYSKLKHALGSLAKISEDKLEREFADGTIDPHIELPIDQHGATVSPMEFAKEFNSETEEAFKTSEDFKNNIKPPLTREFEKRGIAMTDLQLIGYHGITDFATTAITLAGIIKTKNAILDNLRTQTEILRDQPSAQKQKPETVHNDVQTPTPEAKEFHEPEETHVESITPILMDKDNNIIMDESKDSKLDQKIDGMPDFGDTDLLEDMQKLAEREHSKENNKKSNKKP